MSNFRNTCTKYWFVTLNNYTEEEYDMFSRLPQLDWVESCICCKDIGEKETPHLHAVIACTKKQRRTFLENRLGGRCNIEHAKDLYGSWQYVAGRGDHADNKEVFVSYNPPKAVQRKARNEAHEDARARALQIISDARTMTYPQFTQVHASFNLTHPKAYRDFRSFTDVRNVKMYEGDLRKKNLWIVGKPGAGKTKLIYQSFENYVTDVYCKPAGKWFEHWYDSNWKCILIDDINHYNEQRQWSIDFLKKILDRYPFYVEMKGSSCVIDPRINVVVTSQFNIDDVVINRSDAEALKRRCTTIELTKTETDQTGFSDADKATTIWEFIERITPPEPLPLTDEDQARINTNMGGQENDETTEAPQTDDTTTEGQETTETTDTDSIVSDREEGMPFNFPEIDIPEWPPEDDPFNDPFDQNPF